ncbi:MAG: tetratricopeptide repeat protein, partial [Myxococcota bacterium]
PQRAFHRWPVSCEVTRFSDGMNIDGPQVVWRSLNLSEGGLFVTAPQTLPEGTCFDIGLQLPNAADGQPIVGTAKVVWRNDNDDTSKGQFPRGMALQFIGLAQGGQERIRRYVTHTFRASSPPTSDIGQTDFTPVVPTTHPVGDISDAFQAEPLDLERLAPGTVLGSYRIVDLLGAGGMGYVYLAEHIQIGRRVALKKLRSTFARNETVVRRFFDEARLVNRLRHQNLVEITDFISDEHGKYFVMELLEGESLGSLQVREGLLPLRRIMRIVLQLCDVLEAVHQAGIIHRDLKPDNILILSRQGNEDTVKLLDFGIAKLKGALGLSGRNITQAGVLLGTPGYMAPEHLLGRTVDYRYDIYALGVILFQLVTGRKPFEGTTWHDVLTRQATEEAPCPTLHSPRALPKALVHIIKSCLAIDPNCRPRSMAHLGAQLAAALPVEAHDSDEVSSLPGFRRAHPPHTLWHTVVQAGVLAAATAVGTTFLITTTSGELMVRGAPVAMDRFSPPDASVQVGAPADKADTQADPSQLQQVSLEAIKQDNAALREISSPNAENRPSPRKTRPSRLRTNTAREPITQDMQTPEQIYLQGLALLAKNKVSQAVEAFNQVVALQPHYAEAFRALGWAHSRLGQKRRAAHALETYVRLVPTSPDASQLRILIEDLRH